MDSEYWRHRRWHSAQSLITFIQDLRCVRLTEELPLWATPRALPLLQQSANADVRYTAQPEGNLWPIPCPNRIPRSLSPCRSLGVTSENSPPAAKRQGVHIAEEENKKATRERDAISARELCSLFRQAYTLPKSRCSRITTK